MRALIFNEQLHFTTAHSLPALPDGWTKVQVLNAGICGTDLEITRGYKGFKGVIGHEFIGRVADCDDEGWIGQRVVGEINAACGQCTWCARRLGRHCPYRTVLGIRNHDGCMADYCALPTANLKPVPPGISNERGVFVEPLSAACEILEQVSLHGHEKVVVLGDGRLGILCAWVLSTAVRDITLVGHHPEKLTLAAWQHLKVALDTSLITAPVDVVIEATGRPDGLQDALALCRARGTIVLKSTLARSGDVNLASMVVNEQTMIGSRCGRFEAGLHLLEAHPDLPLERLITARYPLEQGVAAFARANAPGALKVLLDINA